MRLLKFRMFFESSRRMLRYRRGPRRITRTLATYLYLHKFVKQLYLAYVSHPKSERSQSGPKPITETGPRSNLLWNRSFLVGVAVMRQNERAGRRRRENTNTLETSAASMRLLYTTLDRCQSFTQISIIITYYNQA